MIAKGEKALVLKNANVAGDARRLYCSPGSNSNDKHGINFNLRNTCAALNTAEPIDALACIVSTTKGTASTPG